jgi:hypothetical protein
MATVVGVAFPVAVFEIVKGPGFPMLFPLTKPEQPLLKSTAPIAIRIGSIVVNGRLEIPGVLRKPLMSLLDLPRPTAFSTGRGAPMSREDTEMFPAT